MIEEKDKTPASSPRDRAIAYLNRYHLEDGALPWDEHHAEVHDLVEMIQGAAIEVTEYELTDVAREALRVPSRATSDAPAERFEPLEALRRIAAGCAKRGTSHESCDEALDSIYAIACTSRSIADRSTDYRTKQRTGKGHGGDRPMTTWGYGEDESGGDRRVYADGEDVGWMHGVDAVRIVEEVARIRAENERLRAALATCADASCRGIDASRRQSDGT